MKKTSILSILAGCVLFTSAAFAAELRLCSVRMSNTLMQSPSRISYPCGTDVDSPAADGITYEAMTSGVTLMTDGNLKLETTEEMAKNLGFLGQHSATISFDVIRITFSDGTVQEARDITLTDSNKVAVVKVEHHSGAQITSIGLTGKTQASFGMGGVRPNVTLTYISAP